MRKIRVIYLLLLLFSVNVAADDLSMMFSKANGEYDQRKFKKSLSMFEEISNLQDSSLFYNLGNNYFRLNQIGKSLFYLTKAKNLAPRDSDISYNFNYVKKKVKQESYVRKSWIDKVSLPLSKSETYFVFSLLLSLVILLSSIMLFKTTLLLTFLRNVSIVLSFYFLLCSYNFYFNSIKLAVIIKNNSNVYSGPGSSNVQLFKLEEGVTTNLLKQTPDKKWSMIYLSKDKKGWVYSDYIITDKNQ